MNNIYFIGMPGCGKTTLAKSASEEFSKKYTDLDEYIEQKLKMKIPEIFEKHGEDFFRKCESECLSEIAEKDGIFVAAGGGIVKNAKNIEIMKNSGTVVFIDTPPENILKNSALLNRPLLKDKTAIFKLYGERKDLYFSAADFVCVNTGSEDEAKEKIFEILRKIVK